MFTNKVTMANPNFISQTLIGIWSILLCINCDLSELVFPEPEKYEDLTCKTIDAVKNYRIGESKIADLDESEDSQRLAGLHYSNESSGSETIFVPMKNGGNILRVKGYIEDGEVQLSTKAIFRNDSNVYSLDDWDAASSSSFAPTRLEFNEEAKLLYILESDRFHAVNESSNPSLEFSFVPDTDYEFIDFQWINDVGGQKIYVTARHTTTGAFRIHELDSADGSEISENDVTLVDQSIDTERTLDRHDVLFPAKDGYVQVSHFLPLITDEDFFQYEYTGVNLFSSTDTEKQNGFRFGHFLADFYFARYHPDYLLLAGREWNYQGHFYLTDWETGVTHELDSLKHSQLVDFQLPVDCPPPNRDFSFLLDDFKPKTDSITIYRSKSIEIENQSPLNLYLFITPGNLVAALVDETKGSLAE